MVDLQRGVLDVEAVAERRLELAPAAMAVVALSNKHVDGAGHPDIAIDMNPTTPRSRSGVPANFARSAAEI